MAPTRHSKDEAPCFGLFRPIKKSTRCAGDALPKFVSVNSDRQSLNKKYVSGKD